MNDTGQNWVLVRANCTLQDSFDAIKQAVDIDVDSTNLPPISGLAAIFSQNGMVHLW